MLGKHTLQIPLQNEHHDPFGLGGKIQVVVRGAVAGSESTRCRFIRIVDMTMSHFAQTVTQRIIDKIFQFYQAFDSISPVILNFLGKFEPCTVQDLGMEILPFADTVFPENVENRKLSGREFHILPPQMAMALAASRVLIPAHTCP